MRAIVLIAKSLGKKGHQLELCTSNDAYREILELNHAVVKEVSYQEAYVDVKNKIVTTPAFLGTQNLYEIQMGIDTMVKELMALL